MRLIDADAIHSTLADWQLMLSETYGTNDEFVRCLEDVLCTVDNTPTIAAPRWVRCDSRPPEKDDAYAVCWLYGGAFYWCKLLFLDGKWQTENVPDPDYWMPMEPPKEDA